MDRQIEGHFTFEEVMMVLQTSAEARPFLENVVRRWDLGAANAPRNTWDILKAGQPGHPAWLALGCRTCPEINLEVVSVPLCGPPAKNWSIGDDEGEDKDQDEGEVPHHGVFFSKSMRHAHKPTKIQSPALVATSLPQLRLAEAACLLRTFSSRRSHFQR